jgi:hypothetical protein
MVMTSLNVCGYVTTFSLRMLKLEETDAGVGRSGKKLAARVGSTNESGTIDADISLPRPFG